MKHLKRFENLDYYYEDIKVSEANKLKSLPMFDFLRRFSEIFGYYIEGKRTILPLEYINIYKKVNYKGNKKFFLNIRRSPGYFTSLDLPNCEKECEFKYTFDDVKSLIEFLKDYEWYDKK